MVRSHSLLKFIELKGGYGSAFTFITFISSKWLVNMMFDNVTKICTIDGLFPICTDSTVRTKPFFIIFRFYTRKIKGKP